MENRFEMGDRVVCVKEHETLKIGSHYSIKGGGDLSMNALLIRKVMDFVLKMINMDIFLVEKIGGIYHTLRK